MSAEGFFKGVSDGLNPVIQYTAEEQMQRAQLMEQDNLSRFHEQSEDVRAGKQRDFEKGLHDIDQQAVDRRQSAELKQNQAQFEKTFGMKVGEDFESRVIQAQDLASKQLADMQLKIQQNPMLQMQYTQLLTLQQQAQAEADPAKRAALQSQIDANPLNRSLQQGQQQAIAGIMSVATNPTEYASLAVRFGRQSPEQASILARAKFGSTAGTTPVLNPPAHAQPSQPKAGTPASAPSGKGDFVTPDMFDLMRKKTMGPGTQPVDASQHFGMMFDQPQPGAGNDILPPQGP